MCIMQVSRLSWVLVLPALVAGRALPSPQCPALLPEDARLLSTGAAAGDLFGSCAATSGDRIAIGAVWDSDDGSQAGSVRVFHWNGADWETEARLVGDDTGRGDQFGTAVDLDGELLIVGAWRADAVGVHSGAAYVFRRTAGSWVQEARLVGSDTQAEDLFGAGVAIQGDTAVVGSWWHDTDGIENAGQAYVFRFDGAEWVELATLAAADAEVWDEFGLAVDLDLDRIVVGAPTEDTLGVATGAVYVFREQGGAGWLEEQKLLGSSVGVNDRLGSSVAIEGGTLVFGSAEHSQSPGSACVFEHDGVEWLERARLTACDGVPGDGFGTSVALAGDLLVAGAVWRDAQVPAPGAAYTFLRSGPEWRPLAKLFATDLEFENHFGIAVAANSERIVVGANWSAPLGYHSGAAYVFDREPVLGESYCASQANSSGFAASIGATGSTSLSSADLLLRAFVGPSGTPGMFFYGSATAQLPFGDGYLCVSPFYPGLMRLRPLAQFGASGVALLPVDYASLPGGGEIVAGSTWNFQFWYRDPLLAGGTGFNLSNGLRLTFGP
jgi:hypothetical protein